MALVITRVKKYIKWINYEGNVQNEIKTVILDKCISSFYTKENSKIAANKMTIN